MRLEPAAVTRSRSLNRPGSLSLSKGVALRQAQGTNGFLQAEGRARLGERLRATLGREAGPHVFAVDVRGCDGALREGCGDALGVGRRVARNVVPGEPPR